jgi:hypothetical protein
MEKTAKLTANKNLSGQIRTEGNENTKVISRTKQRGLIAGLEWAVVVFGATTRMATAPTRGFLWIHERLHCSGYIS